MKLFLAGYLPWLLSCITLYMTFLQGKKRLSSWVVGLFNQFLWFFWMAAAEAWGFLPLNIGLTYLYLKNYQIWKKDIFKEMTEYEKS